MSTLFLDIETLARPEAEALLPEPIAPANYKDAAKIGQYIAEARAKQREKMALNPATCQVATICWAVDSRPAQAADISSFEDERAFLADALPACRQASMTYSGVTRVVGYNIAFDLRVLRRRACLLGVSMPEFGAYRKYQVYPVLDLMQVWHEWGEIPYASLAQVCRECGIEPPTGDGADVATMAPEQRIEHCLSDVGATRELYLKGKGWYWD